MAARLFFLAIVLSVGNSLDLDPGVLDLVTSETGQFESILDGILYSRVVGTEEYERAKSYIVDTLADLGWKIEHDKFTEDTVNGTKDFDNIIARWNPDAPKQLILACHYETKITPVGFVGALDAAVPCAMIIDLAKTLDNILDNQVLEDNDIGLTLVFFDGEEAFVFFSQTDGLYGSRHLADLWFNTTYSPPAGSGLDMENELDRIDLFILLDLLGTTKMKIPSTSFDIETSTNNPFYDRAYAIERELSILVPTELDFMLTGDVMNYPVTDDQRPFTQKGVKDVLHLICRPFPDEWHTLNDNKDALDFDYIDRLNMILRVFVLDHLQLKMH